jgi:hypothetical protein
MSAGNWVRFIKLDTYLVREIASPTAIAIASAIGFSYALSLFGPNVVAGTGTFWRWPSGVTGGALDIRETLSGYYWTVQDGWHWPLLYNFKADWPHGANTGLMDVVPLAALFGRSIHSFTGIVIDLLPLWVSGSFVLNSVALTNLVRSLDQRSSLAAILAAGIGSMCPIVHHSFGHIALASPWVFVFALALFAGGRNLPFWGPARSLGFVALAGLAAGIHLYLYVMTATIAVAAFLQAAANRQIKVMHALAWNLAVLAAGVIPLWAFGLLSAPGISQSTVQFGQDSMNLLSPFWPQTSGLFRWTGIYWLTRGSIGATNGQYVGYSYVGFGALLLVTLALFRNWRVLLILLRKYWIMTTAMAVLTLWAASNRIYLGPYLIATFPVPNFLLHTVLAWFRAEGRFFWPVAWMIVAMGIAGSIAKLKPGAAIAVVAAALIIQWVDLSLWRAKIATAIEKAGISAIGPGEVIDGLSKSIGQSGHVTVVPSIFCSSVGVDYDAIQSIAAEDVQLLAARVNAAMRWVYLARRDVSPCDYERASNLTKLIGGGTLVVISDPGHYDRVSEARRLFDCHRFDVGVYCVRREGGGISRTH